MTEFKGTKGKWKYNVKYGKNSARIVVDIPQHNHINEIILGRIYDDDCTVSTCCKSEEHANALLISKAPEMLDMLNKIFNNIEKNGIAIYNTDGGNVTENYYSNLKQLIEEATNLNLL